MSPERNKKDEKKKSDKNDGKKMKDLEVRKVERRRKTNFSVNEIAVVREVEISK